MELPEITKYTEPKTKLNQRQALIKMFVDRLNSERGEYPEVTGEKIAIRLSHVKTEHLYDFYRDCEEARKFGSYFYWSLKTK